MFADSNWFTHRRTIIYRTSFITSNRSYIVLVCSKSSRSYTMCSLNTASFLSAATASSSISSSKSFATSYILSIGYFPSSIFILHSSSPSSIVLFLYSQDTQIPTRTRRNKIKTVSKKNPSLKTSSSKSMQKTKTLKI